MRYLRWFGGAVAVVLMTGGAFFLGVVMTLGLIQWLG